MPRPPPNPPPSPPPPLSLPPPPQRGLLVRAALPRLRPGVALVRRPRAPLEPRGMGGAPARRRGRPLADRGRGSPQRRATGTRASLYAAADRRRIAGLARYHPLPPSSRLGGSGRRRDQV